MRKEDIDFIYNLYVEAVIKLASVCEIKMVGIYEKGPVRPEIPEVYNPYFDDDWLKTLGESLLENGTHWVYITQRRKFWSGNHRIMALRHMCELGKIDKDYKVLCIDITNSSFQTLTLETLKAKTVEEIEEHGLKTVKKGFNNYRVWIQYMIRIPKILRYILYDYKKETGKEYEPIPVVNDYIELQKAANRERRKRHETTRRLIK